MSNKKTIFMRDWSQMPEELLHEIANYLKDNPFELRRFAAVCHLWRSCTRLQARTPSTPIVSIPNYSEEDKKAHRATGCKLLERTIYTLRPRKQQQSLVKPWILKVEEETHRVCLWDGEDLPDAFHLIDPVSSYTKMVPARELSFPRVLNQFEFEIHEIGKEHVLVRMDGDYRSGDKNYEIYIQGKFVTSYSSTATSNRDFTIMGLPQHSHKELLLMRGEDRNEEEWSSIPIEVEGVWYEDIIHYKERFFAVENSGKMCVIDPSTLSSTVVANPIYHPLVELPDGGDDAIGIYDMEHDMQLVESHGELFLIDIFSMAKLHSGGSPQFFPVDDCKVFKIVEKEEQWIQVHDLQDRVFLVGDSCSYSYSLLASDFPRCQPNCIYFVEGMSCFREADNGDNFSYNMGVFNLADGKFVQFDSLLDHHQQLMTFGKFDHLESYHELFWPPPAWISSCNPN